MKECIRKAEYADSELSSFYGYIDDIASYIYHLIPTDEIPSSLIFQFNYQIHDVCARYFDLQKELDKLIFILKDNCNYGQRRTNQI